MKLDKDNSRLRRLSDEYISLEHKLKLGGGPAKIEKIHKQGKLMPVSVSIFARSWIHSIRDRPAGVGDQYDGQARRGGGNGCGEICRECRCRQ
jgi:hypothetical protein